MPDELEAVAPIEAEAPIDLDAETLPEIEGADPQIEAPEPEEELEEFDWNGKPIKGPKGLKDGVLMHADYTKKTQEVAAHRKELEAREQRIAQQTQASEEELNLRGQLYGLKTQLDQYAKVDWNQWMNDDPVEANRGWMQFQQLKETAGVTFGELQNRMTQRTQSVQQETAKRLEETRDYAQTKIPGWSPEVDAKVTEFATKELGFDQDTLRGAYTPQIYRAIHLAWLGHQTLNKPAPAKVVPQPAPLQVVASKASPPVRKSLEDMSIEEHSALFKKQQAARGR